MSSAMNSPHVAVNRKGDRFRPMNHGGGHERDFAGDERRVRDNRIESSGCLRVGRVYTSPATNAKDFVLTAMRSWLVGHMMGIETRLGSTFAIDF
jgi:hypothetical protein